VSHDVLKFLYIPDHVSAYIAAKLAHKVYRYQIENIRTKAQITHAVMITMGGCCRACCCTITWRGH